LRLESVKEWKRMWKKTKVKRISREPSPVQIMILENVKYFNCLGSMIRVAARCTRDIKSTIAMAKAAFNRKKTCRNTYCGID
jgi:hypothetical protein